MKRSCVICEADPKFMGSIMAFSDLVLNSPAINLAIFSSLFLIDLSAEAIFRESSDVFITFLDSLISSSIFDIVLSNLCWMRDFSNLFTFLRALTLVSASSILLGYSSINFPCHSLSSLCPLVSTFVNRLEAGIIRFLNR